MVINRFITVFQFVSNRNKKKKLDNFKTLLGVPATRRACQKYNHTNYNCIKAIFVIPVIFNHMFQKATTTLWTIVQKKKISVHLIPTHRQMKVPSFRSPQISRIQTNRGLPLRIEVLMFLRWFIQVRTEMIS